MNKVTSKKENKKSFNVMLTPKIKNLGTKLAFNENRSFSGYIESLILADAKAKAKKGA